MATRRVKTTAAALSRTNAPLAVGDGLENAIAGLGTSRDKRVYSGYAMPYALDRQTLEAMYRTSWLAGKIVDVVAEDMTRAWLSFNGDDESGSAQRKAISALEKKLGVKAKVNEALKWSRLYGGCVIVLGMADSVNNAAAMMQPLRDEQVKKGDLRYLAVLDRWRVSASPDLVIELGDPNFGLPAHYLVAESGLRIHHSRILRFNGNKLPYFSWTANARWDDSVLQRVYEKVRDTDGVSAGLASMVFEANVDVLRLAGLGEMLQANNGEAQVQKRLGTALLGKSFTKALVLDANDQYEKKGNNFSGLSQVVQQVMVEMCGAADIPMTRLYGQSASGLNATGEGDARNYFDMISAKQEAELRPQLERLYQVMAMSALGSVPENFEFEFGSLWQMSDKDKAVIQLQNAQRDQLYVAMGVVPEHVVTAELLDSGTYRNITPETVKMVEELGEGVDLPNIKPIPSIEPSDETAVKSAKPSKPLEGQEDKEV